MSTVKFLTEIKEPKVSELGGKGYSLAVLINNGFNVPRGFVVTSDVFIEFLKHNDLVEKLERPASEIDKDNFEEKSKKIRDLILKGEMPKGIASEVKGYFDNLNAQHVSIRSSATSEDSLKTSFAGLFDTFLNIKVEITPDYIIKCWASLFNERAVIYRIRKEMPHLESMAVVVQEMIPAEVSVITFTVHPTNEKALLIEASYGLGDLIVSGKIVPDDYVIDRKTLEIVEKKIGKKNKMSTVESEGTKVVDIEKELAEKQVLSDNKIKEIAKTCLKIEKNFNYSQDIEWCISNNKLWLLQSRAITGGVK